MQRQPQPRLAELSVCGEQLGLGPDRETSVRCVWGELQVRWFCSQGKLSQVRWSRKVAICIHLVAGRSADLTSLVRLRTGSWLGVGRERCTSFFFSRFRQRERCVFDIAGAKPRGLSGPDGVDSKCQVSRLGEGRLVLQAEPFHETPAGNV